MKMGSPEDGRFLTEDEKVKNRRGFLKKVGAGLATVGLGAVTGVVGNKYLEKEKEVNKFFELFNGKEENFAYATKAMSLLIHEMQLENVARVNLSGTGHPNPAIDFLRGFITKHLNSKVSKSYYTAKGIILTDGYYTESTLLMLIGEANNILNGGKYPPTYNYGYNDYGYTEPPKPPSPKNDKIDSDANQKKFNKPGKNIL